MTEGAVNKVLYNVDQRADTTEAEKRTARENIGAVGIADIEPVMDERYKLLQQPINATFASFAVIDRYSQTSNGVVDIHCSYIYPATESTNGLMSAGDKTKLDNIPYNAEANVQSDWDETDPTSDAFIKNKPSVSLQVQADWDESDNTLPSYIRNKPTIPSGDQLVPSATSSDEGKVLVVDENGHPVWENDATGITAVAHDTTLTGDGTSASPLSVNSNTIQEKLTPGTGITITNNVISADTQVQSDWSQSDNTAVDYIKNKPDLSVYATKTELTSGLADKQDTLTAGSNITISNNVISATAAPQQQADWAQSDSSAVDFIKNKPQNLVQDANYVHTDNNFTTAEKTKLGGIESGAEQNVQANWTESDSSSDAYIQNKPQNLVQDANYVHTDNNFTTSEKTKLSGIQAGAEQNVQSDWSQADSSADDFIKNKPQNLVQDANYVHTDNNFTNSDKSKLDNIQAGAEQNVQANWAETDTTADSYIQNKPQNLVQDANYVHTDNNFTSAEKTKLAGIEAGAEQNVQSDWNQTDTSADDFIKNKPTIPEIPPMKELVAGSGIGLVETEFDVTISATSQTDNNFTNAYKTKLDGIAAGAEVNVQSNWNETNSSSDAFIRNKPTIPELSWQQETQGASNSFPADQLKIHQDYHTVTMHTTGSSDVQLGYVVPNIQSADDGKVLKAINDGVGGTAVTWGDAPNADWNATSGASEILNKPSIPDIVSTTTSLPPVDTDIATLRIFTDGRVQGDSSTLGCIAPVPAQADAGKVLTAYWSGSPSIGTARWEPAPEAHTVGFIDVIL